MSSPEPAPSRTSRVAVVLGSSFHGVYAHSGFLSGLHDAGIRPDRIAGSSGGALAGALFSSGLRGDALKAAATSRALRLSYADLGGLWRLPGVLTSFWSSGIFHGRRTVRHLRSVLGEVDLSSLALDIAVTDVTRERADILRSGPLAESVMASCAVPGLFKVQEFGGRRFLDGGIALELPFEHFIDDPEIDTIILHRIHHEQNSGPTVSWETIASVISVAHHTACNELHRLREDLCRLKGKRLIACETTTPFPGVVSGRRAPLCYDRGFDSGKSAATRL